MRPTKTAARTAKERRCKRLKGLAVDNLCARYKLASSMLGRDFEGDGALPLVVDVVLTGEEAGESHTWRGCKNVRVTKEGEGKRCALPFWLFDLCPNQIRLPDLILRDE